MNIDEIHESIEKEVDSYFELEEKQVQSHELDPVDIKISTINVYIDAILNLPIKFKQNEIVENLNAIAFNDKNLKVNSEKFYYDNQKLIPLFSRELKNPENYNFLLEVLILVNVDGVIFRFAKSISQTKTMGFNTQEERAEAFNTLVKTSEKNRMKILIRPVKGSEYAYPRSPKDVENAYCIRFTLKN